LHVHHDKGGLDSCSCSHVEGIVKISRPFEVKENIKQIRQRGRDNSSK
jgi:hypothetical protein